MLPPGVNEESIKTDLAHYNCGLRMMQLGHPGFNTCNAHGHTLLCIEVEAVCTRWPKKK